MSIKLQQLPRKKINKRGFSDSYLEHNNNNPKKIRYQKSVVFCIARFFGFNLF